MSELTPAEREYLRAVANRLRDSVDEPRVEPRTLLALLDAADERDAYEQLVKDGQATNHRLLIRCDELGVLADTHKAVADERDRLLDAIAAHNKRMDSIADGPRPTTPAEALRRLADWFDEVYLDAGTGNDGVQQDLRRFADQSAAQAATIEGLCGLLEGVIAEPGQRRDYIERITAAIAAARKGT